MTEPVIVRVNTENITPLWPQVLPLVERALARIDTLDAEDVRKALLASQSHLWIQWSGEVDAALLTEFVAYPKGIWLRLGLMGAKPKTPVRWDEFERAVNDWGRAHQCKGKEVWGRFGWAKRYADARRDFVVLRQSL